MNIYSNGDQVQLLTIYEGRLCTVYGKVVNVIESDRAYHHLTIMGKTSTGHVVKTTTYTDDKTLTKQQS